MCRHAKRVTYWLLVLLGTYGFIHAGAVPQRSDSASSTADAPDAAVVNQFIDQYCVDCHNSDDKTAGLALDSIRAEDLIEQSRAGENVVRMLRARRMPPIEMPRPDDRSYQRILFSLETALDGAAAEHPNPGRTDTFRRLTRTEYRNAIRDLLALEVDVTALLPADEDSHGFDNVTVGDLSPTLLNRYIAAAQKISRLAIGGSQTSAGVHTFRLPPDRTQEERVEGLPIGTRGGALIPHNFPQDGQYEIEIRLMRDRDEHVEGLSQPHELEVLLDRRRVQLFTVKPPSGKSETSDGYSQLSHANVDRHLKTRVAVAAGPHQLGVTFLKNPSRLLETKRQPLHVHFNMYRHPRIGPAIYQVSIAGPLEVTGPGDTLSRQRIFGRRPASPGDEEGYAQQILSTLMRRAYRRPVDEEDLQKPMEFYREAREQHDFDAGIEMALSAVLVNPQFLFRIEQDPDAVAPHAPYHISELDLASRLSFFLWSSIPDDELLDLATRGELSHPEILKRQTLRMLADERSRALVNNFAGQWLYLRNLESSTPDMRLFPDFDDNVRQAFRQETELFFESVLREDRSVLDLLTANYTYLNERLAKHYKIPHVYGSRFRRVALAAGSKRGGLLRHGSILTVTSYATRTSPVIRGKWILENILGMPPPPPPANVPALKDNAVAADLSVRERLAEHRADPACARCHDLIDPVGFCLENFDAVGRWRDLEDDKPVDAAGGLPDGSQFIGVAGLEQGLLDHPEIFVGTLSEKLLTYALGRGVEHFDAPAIRSIVRDARADGYRFSSLILGIVQSTPFQMRTSQ